MPFVRKKKCLSSRTSTETTSIVPKSKQKALLFGRDNGVGSIKRKGHTSKRFRSSPKKLKSFQISLSNESKSSPLCTLDFSDCTISFSSNKSQRNSKGSCSSTTNVGSANNKSKRTRFSKIQPSGCTSPSWDAADTPASNEKMTSSAASSKCKDDKIGGSSNPVETAEMALLLSSNNQLKEEHDRTEYSFSDFEKLERPQCTLNLPTYFSSFTSSPEISSHGVQASSSSSISQRKKIRSRIARSSSVSSFSENNSNDIQTCRTKDVNTKDEKWASSKSISGSKCFNLLRNTKSCARKSTAKERKPNSVCKISSKRQYNLNNATAKAAKSVEMYDCDDEGASILTGTGTSTSLRKGRGREVSGIHENSKSICRQKFKRKTSSSLKASVQQPKNKLNRKFQKNSKELPVPNIKCSCLVNGANVLSKFLRKQSLPTNFSTVEKIESAVRCILYLGLGRPTHPLIYLNLKMQVVDGNIDSSWAKYAATAVQIPKQCPTVSRLLVPVVYEQLEDCAMKHLSKNSSVPGASSEQTIDTLEDRLFSDQTSSSSNELMWDDSKLPYCKELGVSFFNNAKCNSQHSQFKPHANPSTNDSSANSVETFSSTLITEEKDETDMLNSCDDSSVDFNLHLSSDSDCSVDNDSENSRTWNIDSDITSFPGSSKSEILFSKEDREKLDHATIQKAPYRRKGYRKRNRSSIAKAIWEKRKRALAQIEEKIDPDIGGKNQNEFVNDSINSDRSPSMNIAFIKEEPQSNNNDLISPDEDCRKVDRTQLLQCNKKMQLRARRSATRKTGRQEQQNQSLSQGAKSTSISRKMSAEFADSISLNKVTTNEELYSKKNLSTKKKPTLDYEKLISQNCHKVSDCRKNVIIKKEPLSDHEDLNSLNCPTVSLVSGFTDVAEPSRTKQKKRTQQKIRRSLLCKALWQKRRNQTLTQDLRSNDLIPQTADHNSGGKSLDSTLERALGCQSVKLYEENSSSKSDVPIDYDLKNTSTVARPSLQARFCNHQQKVHLKQSRSAIAKAIWEKRRKKGKQGVKKVDKSGDQMPGKGKSNKLSEAKPHAEENLNLSKSGSKDSSPEVFEADNSQHMALKKVDILTGGNITTSDSDPSLSFPELSEDIAKDLSAPEEPLVLSIKETANQLVDQNSEKQGAPNTFEELYTISDEQNSLHDLNVLKDETKYSSSYDKQEVATLRSIKVETAKKFKCDFEDSCTAGEKTPQIQNRKPHRKFRAGVITALSVKRLMQKRKRQREAYLAKKDAAKMDDAMKDFPEKTKKVFRTKAAYEKVKKEVEPILENITDYVCKKEAFDKMEIRYDQDYCPPPDGVFPELETFSDLVEATNIVKWPSTTKDRCARELARLNVNVVKIQNKPNDEAPFKVPDHCSKENCKFGCICKTLDWKLLKNLERCSREKCIFGCNCETLALPQSLNALETSTESPSILSPIMKKRQAESRKCLAVKEFRETIFVSDLKDQGSKIFVKNKQRDRKLPERFKDHFIGVNGKSIPIGGLFKNFSAPAECNNFDEPEPTQLEGPITLNRCIKSGEPTKCLEPAKNEKLIESSVSSCIETSNAKSKESLSCNFLLPKTVKICLEKLEEQPRSFYCLVHAARNCICLRQVRSWYGVNVWHDKIPESIYVPITIWQHLESFKITTSRRKLKDGTSRTNLNLCKFVNRNKHGSYLSALLNREWHHISFPNFAVAKWHSPQFGDFRLQDICYDRLVSFIKYNIALNNLQGTNAQPSRTFWCTSSLLELLQASVKFSTESMRGLNAALPSTSSSVTDMNSQLSDSVNSNACENILQNSEIQDVAPFIDQTDNQGSIISNVCSIALEEFEKFGKHKDGEEEFKSVLSNVPDMSPPKLTCEKKTEVERKIKVIRAQLISKLNKGSSDGIQLTNLEGSSSGGNLVESHKPSWSSILTNILPRFKARHQWLVFDLRQNFDTVKLGIKLNGQKPVVKCIKRELFDKMSFDAHLNLRTVRYFLLKSCSSGSSFSVLGIPGLSSMVFFGPFMRNDSLNLVPLQKIPDKHSLRMVPLKEVFVQYKILRSQTVHDFLLVHDKIKSSVVDMISKAEEAFIYYYFWEPASNTCDQVPDNVSPFCDEIFENPLEISGHQQNAVSNKKPHNSSSSVYVKSNLNAEHISQMSTEEIYRHVSRIQADHNYYSEHSRDEANDLDEHSQTASIHVGDKSDVESVRCPKSCVDKEPKFSENDQVSKAVKRHGVIQVRGDKKRPKPERSLKRNDVLPVKHGPAEESNESVEPDPLGIAPSDEHSQTANIHKGDVESVRHPKSCVDKEPKFSENDQVSKAVRRKGVIQKRGDKKCPKPERSLKRNDALPVKPGPAEESNQSVEPDPLDTAPPGFVSKYLMSSVKEVGYVDVYASTTSCQLIVNLSYMELSFDNVVQASDWLNNTLGKYVIFFPVDFKPRWSLVEKSHKLPADWNLFDVQRISKYVYLTEDGPKIKVANDIEDTKSDSEPSTSSAMDDFERDVAANFSDDEVKETSNSTEEIEEGRITSKIQEHKKVSKIAEKEKSVSAISLHVREVKKRKATSEIEEIKELLESKEVKEISETEKLDETSEIKASEEDSARGNYVLLDDQSGKKPKTQGHDKTSKNAEKGESVSAASLHVGGVDKKKGISETEEIKELSESKEVKEISETGKSDETSGIKASEEDSASGNHDLLKDQTEKKSETQEQDKASKTAEKGESVLKVSHLVGGVDKRKGTSEIKELLGRKEVKELSETEKSDETSEIKASEEDFASGKYGLLDDQTGLYIFPYYESVNNRCGNVITSEINEREQTSKIEDLQELQDTKEISETKLSNVTPQNEDLVNLDHQNRLKIASCDKLGNNSTQNEIYSTRVLSNSKRIVNEEVFEDGGERNIVDKSASPTSYSVDQLGARELPANMDAIIIEPDGTTRPFSGSDMVFQSGVNALSTELPSYVDVDNVDTLAKMLADKLIKQKTLQKLKSTSNDKLKSSADTVAVMLTDKLTQENASHPNEKISEFKSVENDSRNTEASSSRMEAPSHQPVPSDYIILVSQPNNNESRVATSSANSNTANFLEPSAKTIKSITSPLKNIETSPTQLMDSSSKYVCILPKPTLVTKMSSPEKKPMSCEPIRPKPVLVTVPRRIHIDLGKEFLSSDRGTRSIQNFVTSPSKLDAGSYLASVAGINRASTPKPNIQNTCKHKQTPITFIKPRKGKPVDLDNPASFFSEPALKRAIALNQALKKTQQFQMETVLDKKQRRKKRKRKCSKKLNEDCAPNHSEGETKSLCEDTLPQEPSKKQHDDDTDVQETEKASSTTEDQSKYNLRRKKIRKDEKIGEVQEDLAPAENRKRKRKETGESSVEAVPNADEDTSENKCFNDKNQKERFRRVELRRLAKRLLTVAMANVSEGDRPKDRSVATNAILKLAKLAVNRLKVESQMLQIEHNLLRSKTKFLSEKLKGLGIGSHPAPKKTQGGNSTFKLLNKAVSSQASNRGKKKKQRTVLPELFISNTTSESPSGKSQMAPADDWVVAANFDFCRYRSQ